MNRKEEIKALLSQYQDKLEPVIAVKDTLELERLPDILQKFIKVITIQNPKFSNISALTTVNFVLGHLSSQLRCKINDIAYSKDILGANFYCIHLSTSGSGKDNSLQSVLGIFKPILDKIEEERNKPLIEKAIKKALRQYKSAGTDVLEEDLDYEDYKEFLPPKSNLLARGNSTIGGLSKAISNFEKQPLGCPTILMTEFASEFLSGGNVKQVLLMGAEMFDMGIFTPPEYKTEELKESPINGMFISLLGHTSPKMLLSSDKAKKDTLELFQMFYARRSFLTQPDEREAYENSKVPVDYNEAKNKVVHNRKLLQDYTIELTSDMTDIFQELLYDPAKRIARFSDEAASLYDDYKEYCSLKAETIPTHSIVHLEMNGRAFKMARVAALWSFAIGSNEISYDILASAIYYAEYNSKYIVEFEKKLTAKSFVLLADYLINTENSITLDKAITNGFIGTKITDTFKEVLEPLNSYIRDKGIVVYDNDIKSFVYEPFKMIKTNTYYVSVNKVDGIPKEDRTSYLGVFESVYKIDSFSTILALLNKDRIYSFFKYKDNKRSQANIESNTRVIALDVDKSEVELNVLHDYLAEYKHIISTTSNKENLHKFRILLFIDIELDGQNVQQYKYVTRRLASDLLIDLDPASSNPAQPVYAYKDSYILYKEKGELWSVKEYIADYVANKVEEPRVKSAPKTGVARSNHVNKLLSDVNKVFYYAIEAPIGQGNLMLARASLHMLSEGFKRDEYESTIKYINSRWSVPMNDSLLHKNIIDQYSIRFEE
jgi:hypothetical protein